MTGGWPLERVLFALAGAVTLASAALAVLVSPWFLLLAVFVGLNQWFVAGAGACRSGSASPSLKIELGDGREALGSPI